MHVLHVLIPLLIVAYFLTVFFLARLFVPFMGFKQYSPPGTLPSEVVETIRQLEQSSRDAREYLETAYEFVRKHWHSERLKTITRLPKIFRTDIGEIWRSPGYAHCTTINFILYTLLAHSRFFTAADVRIRHTFFNAVLHQYLQVRIGAVWIDADPSTTYLHLPLGQRARLFG